MDKENPKQEVSGSGASDDEEKKRLIGEIGIDEGRRSLDHQVASLRQQKDHFIEIMKLNLICLSILVAALGVGRVSLTGLNPLRVALPLASFLLSISLSISTFHSINPTIGMDNQSVLDLDPNENLNENVVSIKNTYADGIKQNKSKISKSNRNMLISYFSTLAGISSSIGVVLIGSL